MTSDSTTNSRKRKHQEEEKSIEMNYVVKDGIRYLSPYWSTYKCCAKGRWLNRKLVDVFSKEFISTNPHYAKIAIITGRMFINGKKMTDPNYIIKNANTIVHVAHRHEHEILDQKIEVIDDNENFYVVNKPPSLPVHACGKYKIHSVLEQIRLQNGINGLRVLYRLDRTVSGVLIFAKNYEADVEFKEIMKNGGIHKEYVALVEGIFPDNEIVCEEPLGNLVINMGIQCIRKDGKNARSIFNKIWSDGKKSLVKCKIESGRTHQIRVHLQYIGYPIINDKLYNTKAWGENKGKNADYGKDIETLAKHIGDSHKSSLWHENPNLEYEENMRKWANGEVEPPVIEINDTETLDQLPNFDPLCLSCNVVKKPIPSDHFQLYLHCLKYETDKWKYETKLPAWAERGTNIELKDVINKRFLTYKEKTFYGV